MRKLISRMHRAEAGTTTAEYAICTLMAAGLAALLGKILTGSAVLHALTDLVLSAFRIGQ